MTNKDFIKAFINGKRHGNYSHLFIDGNRLINYSTELLRIEGNTVYFNIRKYSPTTSRIQTAIKSALDNSNFEVIEYENNNQVHWWY